MLANRALDEPRYKYGQNKQAINIILDKQSKRKIEKVTKYLLINKYRKSVKENIYQYKNIALLGIILFLSFFTISNIFSIYNYRGLFDTINKSINNRSAYTFFWLNLKWK